MPTPRKRTPALTARQQRASVQEAHFEAEASDLAHGLAPHLGDPLLFRNAWSIGKLEEMFAKSRGLIKGNDYWGGIQHIRLCYFADDIRYLNSTPALRKWEKDAKIAGLRLDRLELDVWNEFLTCDNAIVFWRTAEEGKFAVPVVLDSEVCTYSDALGAESLKVRPTRTKLTETQKNALGPRWAAALATGKCIELDRSQGENFKVLTWGKVGSGLGFPRIGQILDKLGFRELLEIADMSAGWEHGDLARHITKGHAIVGGDRGGKPDHFITKKQSQKILENMKGKRGARTIVSNFDLSIAWKYLDPRFFDAGKYAAVTAKLKTWGGAAALIYDAGQVSPQLMSAFGVEGRRYRRMVGEFLSSILNDETFHGGAGFRDGIEVAWNPQSFLDIKMMLEWLRAGYSNGLISPQTARHALGVDNQVEMELMKAAHADPEGYRPVFEAKQGMAASNKGGRPSDKPGTETPPTNP